VLTVCASVFGVLGVLVISLARILSGQAPW
jgi:hypothetical protein